MQKDEDRRWVSRTTASLALRAVVLVGPLAASLAFAWLATHLTVVPDANALVVLRWVVIATLSTLVLVVTERLLRRLLPLVALLRLSLSFPDRAPSRLRIALRTGSTHQLQQRIEDARAGRLGETAGESAIRVLELVAALNLHDPLTRGHSERVRAYTQMIGRELHLGEQELDRLMWAALLHDIGKLLVPTEILNKPGKLTDEEFDVVKLHPGYGKVLVEPLTPWLGEASRAVWEHHERWTGGGYPRGISGDEISLAARVVSVADTFDVITSVRSYKARTSPKAARAELARCAGSQFDPRVVRAFMNASTHQFGWLSGPAAWLAQTTLLPPTAVSAVVRSGLIASGLTVSGLSLAGGAAASTPPPTSVVNRIDDIEFVDEPTASDETTTAARPAGDPVDELEVVDPDGRVGGAPPSNTRVSDDADDTGPTTTVDATTPVGTTATPTTVPSVGSTLPPGSSVPTTTGPPVTLPPTTDPPVTVPPISVPPITVPPITVPVVTVPVISVPPITVPGTPLPPITVPQVSLPPISVPPITLPPVTVPPITLPPVTIPNLFGR